jgi:putative addiction module killer protein
MFTLKQTETFQKWRETIKDSKVRAGIASRLDRMSFGLFGDVKPVGSGVCEMRIHIGPGFRVYYKQIGGSIIVLLCGGDKSMQSKDIKKAIQLAQDLEG